MQLEGAGLTQPSPHTYIVRLKFGKQNYVAVEFKRGEEAAEVAKKLRELAGQVEQRTG